MNDYRITAIVTDPPWSVNCYLVSHVRTGEQLLIDAGDAAERIAAAVEANGKGLRAILLTHGHHDHVGAAAELAGRFNAPCFLHADDGRLLRQAGTYALVFAGRRIERLPRCELFSNERPLPGWLPLSALHTPGHTPGSVCYLMGNTAFTGDTLLFRHVGRTDAPGGDPKALVSSLGLMTGTIADGTGLLPGHGRGWEMAEAREWWKTAAQSPPEYKSFERIS